MDESGQRQQVLVLLYQYRLVATPEEGAIAALEPLILLRIQTTDLTHESAQICLRCFYQQVILASEEAVGMNFNV
jgi:hypothetical protein